MSSRLEDKIDHLQALLYDMKADIVEVRVETKNIAQDLPPLERRVDSLERFRFKLMWLVAGAGASGGLLGSISQVLFGG